MTKRYQLIPAILFILIAPLVFADSIRISQVDSGDLLLNQEVKLYLSVTDDGGNPISGLRQDNFDILESSDGMLFKPVEEITGFQAGINDAGGVNFLLLIDNSESMYWTLEGRKTKSEARRRMTIAKKAVTSFINSIKNPNDTVGVAVYNSYYKLLAAPSNQIGMVEQQLDAIERPKGDAIYTEIYASLSLAIEELGITKGRKAVIILSDGVNNPAYPHTNKINEQFGAKFTPHTTPLEKLQLEGISLYVINFGKRSDKKDRHLKTIAKQSGGVTFDAHSARQLDQVYSKIMNQVQREYITTYRATMDPADRKFVQVKYKQGSASDTVSRTYFSSTVFGQPSESFNAVFLMAIAVAGALLWWISRLKFEKQHRSPSIEVLNAGAGKLSTQVVTLGGEETIIGSSPNADMTIAGLPTVEENHATIVFDPSSKKYALEGKGKMLVNNQLVTTKVLEPGDLINIDGTTMVFDEGADKEDEE